MVTAEIELLLNMVWCFVVYCVQLPVCCIFCLPWLFQSFCLSQSILVMDFQYWSCKSWVSVLVFDIKVLVLVLVLKLLSLGLGLGLETAKSWSWSWISKSWIRVWHIAFKLETFVAIVLFYYFLTLKRTIDVYRSGRSAGRVSLCRGGSSQNLAPIYGKADRISIEMLPYVCDFGH